MLHPPVHQLWGVKCPFSCAPNVKTVNSGRNGATASHISRGILLPCHQGEVRATKGRTNVSHFRRTSSFYITSAFFTSVGNSIISATICLYYSWRIPKISHSTSKKVYTHQFEMSWVKTGSLTRNLKIFMKRRTKTDERRYISRYCTNLTWTTRKQTFPKSIYSSPAPSLRANMRRQALKWVWTPSNSSRTTGLLSYPSDDFLLGKRLHHYLQADYVRA